MVLYIPVTLTLWSTQPCNLTEAGRNWRKLGCLALGCHPTCSIAWQHGVACRQSVMPGTRMAWPAAAVVEEVMTACSHATWLPASANSHSRLRSMPGER
eukprot:scaffold144627_cov21-Tisochrysis_lutea.AAC.3